MRVKFKDIEDGMSTIERSKIIRRWIRECPPDDPIYLSDCLIRAGGIGGPVLLELGEDEKAARDENRDQTLWTLQVLKDEWGKTPKPGDVVKKVNKRSMKRIDGSHVSSMERDIALNDGSYSEQFESIKEYKIDNKLCIRCPFTDAGYFLIHWGVHGKSNRAMTSKKEMSTEPLDYPGGGQKHVHYWRYKEMDKADYDALPEYNKSGVSK